MIAPTFSTSLNGYTLVLGLGETGMAAAHWYLQQKLPVRLADTRSEYQAQVDELLQSYAQPEVELVLGPEALCLSVLDGVDTIVISPGLAVTDAAVAALLAQAHQQQLKVISEIELFAQALADLATQGYTPTVVAVTGTNGKTTVVQLLKHMIQTAGHYVEVAGNISPASLHALQQCLTVQQLPDFWIIELSSFQLAHTYSLPVLAGAVLNLSQDHIDWHGSMAAYAKAKAHLFSMSQTAVVNRDDAATLAMVPKGQPWLSFGLDSPTRPHDLGLTFHQDQEWICTLQTDQDVLAEWMPASAVSISGRHNLSNALAALCLLQITGLEIGAGLAALRTYYGEPHRCQFVRVIRGVSFINDSKGTNVGATVAAIEGLGRSMVLIAGGVAKGQDFTPLAQAIAQSPCKAVVLIGRDAPFLQAALGAITVPILIVSTLNQAVQQAYDLSVEGDVVLLSPACASLDMFRSYIDRGHQFVEAVTELALDEGEVA